MDWSEKSSAQKLLTDLTTEVIARKGQITIQSHQEKALVSVDVTWFPGRKFWGDGPDLRSALISTLERVTEEDIQ